MIIRSVELSNYGPHEHVELTFGTGLNAIIGANGTGKSTVLMAMKGLLSGSWDHPDGMSGVLRKNATTPIATATAVISLSDSNDVTISRILENGVKTKYALEAVINGEKLKLTKSQEIRTWFENTLLLTTDVINNYMFIPQGQMYDFLDASPYIRTSNFSKLCGTSVVEKCRVPLQKMISADRSQIDNTNLRDIDIMQKQMDDCTDKVHKIQAEIRELIAEMTTLGYPEDLPTYRIALVEATNARARIASISSELNSYRVQFDKIEELLKNNELKLEEYSKFIDENADKYQEYLVFMKKHEEESKLIAVHEKYAHDIASATDFLNNLVEPVLDDSLKGYELTQLSVDISTLKGELNSNNYLLTDSELLEGRRTCPTCGAQIEHWTVHIEDIKTKIAEIKSKIIVLDNIYQNVSLFKSDYNDYLRIRSNYKDKLESLKLAKDALPVPMTMNIQQCDDIKTFLRKYYDCTASITRLTTDITQLKVDKASFEAIVVEKTKELINLRRVAAREEELRKEVERMSIQEDKCNEVATKVNDGKAQIKLLNSQKTSLKEWLEQQKERVKELERQKEFLEILQQANDVLSPKNLPNFIHQRVLYSMVEKINEELEIFEADFSVSANEDLSFSVFFVKGANKNAVVSASSLSGGQKVLLSLAYWLSIQSIFAKQIGVMFIDEPCNFLDKDNRDKLLEVFMLLRQRLTERRQQMIIITHEESLLPAFSVINKLSLVNA